MSIALVLAFALFAAPPSGRAAEQGASAAQLLQEACVDTGMQRAAFERLGETRRWRPARMTSSTSAPYAWNVSFRAEGGLVIMSSIPSLPGEPMIEGVTCTVIVQGARPDWRDDLGDVAAGLGMTALPGGGLEGADEMHVWAKGSAETMTATYVEAASKTVSITYVRRDEPASTSAISPAGNL